MVYLVKYFAGGIGKVMNREHVYDPLLRTFHLPVERTVDHTYYSEEAIRPRWWSLNYVRKALNLTTTKFVHSISCL